MKNELHVWKNGKDWLKQLLLMHTALTVGALLIIIVFYYISDMTFGGYESNPDSLLEFIGLFIAIAGVFFSQLMFKRSLPKIRGLSTLDDKLFAYKQSSITSFALLEGPCLINAVFALLTGNLYSIIISLVVLVILYLKRPTEQKVFTDLMLCEEEIREFHD